MQSCNGGSKIVAAKLQRSWTDTENVCVCICGNDQIAYGFVLQAYLNIFYRDACLKIVIITYNHNHCQPTDLQNKRNNKQSKYKSINKCLSYPWYFILNCILCIQLGSRTVGTKLVDTGIFSRDISYISRFACIESDVSYSSTD